MWSKEGEPYLTLGLYVDIGEELSDDEAAAAAGKQVQCEGNSKVEVQGNAIGHASSAASQEITPQDGIITFPHEQAGHFAFRIFCCGAPLLCSKLYHGITL